MSKETNAPSEHRRNTPTLTAQVNQRWPTPTVCGNYNRKGASATSGDGLATAVQNWPTPDASAHKYRLSGNSQQSNSLMALAGGKLNPDWTEWLMGWPPGWTDLKPLEMDKSPCVPQQHGKYSVKESND
jgi:DNA (cytosine-5)-methyltransferase 1